VAEPPLGSKSENPDNKFKGNPRTKGKKILSQQKNGLSHLGTQKMVISGQRGGPRKNRKRPEKWAEGTETKWEDDGLKKGRVEKLVRQGGPVVSNT